MDTHITRCGIPARDRLFHKLHPSRFPLMPGVMAAIVGFLLEEPFVSPPIAEIVVTSDGFLLARTEGESCANVFIGRYLDLVRNWLILLAAACLTTDETVEAQVLFAAKIGYFGPTTA
jgi:hypothetical protein